MKRSGFSVSGRENAMSRTMAQKITDTNTDNNDNPDITLSSISDAPPLFTVAELSATRDGNNQALMTWNANLVSGRCNMTAIYRILTPSNPANIDWHDEWYSNSPPGDILTGLGDFEYREINVGEGDLYHEWIDADTYEGYYIVFLYVYNVSGSESGYGRYYYLYKRITNYCIANAPSLTYNQSSNNFTIGTSMSGRRILEFHRTDRSYGYPTSISNQDTLNEALLTSIINEEWDSSEYYLGYYYADDYTLERWAKGRYTVGVNFRDSTNRTRISNAINAALSEINSVLNNYGVYFTRSSTATSGDITITVDTEYNLYGIDPFEDGVYVYGGTWTRDTDGSGYIVSANVQLANDFFDGVPYNTYEQVALEEITQAMGTGYDQWEYIDDTIHVEFNYFNKPDYLTTNDKNLLNLIYSGAVAVGSDCTEFSKALNIPKGVYMPSSSNSNTTMNVSANFLEGGAKYAVRVFIVNSNGEVSYTSNWVNITTPEHLRPANWQWQTNIAVGATIPFSNGAFHPVTANEWNAFTKRINEFRDYMGISPYSFTTVSSNATFTPAIYNEAVAAIKGISGYGTYLSYATAGVTDALKASVYLSLRDELNAIP